MAHLIIIKDNFTEIKRFCDKKGINYEVYHSDFAQLHPAKIKMFSDYGEATEDKELEAEKAKLEQADEADEYDEYEQEEWAK